MTDSKLPLDEQRIREIAEKRVCADPFRQVGYTIVAIRTALSEALRAQTEAQPVAEIHFPQWGEPIVAWHGHTLDKPCNVTVYGRPAPPLRESEDVRDARRFVELAKRISGEQWERISGHWPTSDAIDEYRAAIDAALPGGKHE